MICDDGRIAANNGKQSPGPEAFLCGRDQENYDWMSYVSEEALERVVGGFRQAFGPSIGKSFQGRDFSITPSRIGSA